jgi:hypothetical protein
LRSYIVLIPNLHEPWQRGMLLTFCATIKLTNQVPSQGSKETTTIIRWKRPSFFPPFLSNAAADVPYLISSRTHNMIADMAKDEISPLEYYFPKPFLPTTKTASYHVLLSLQVHSSKYASDYRLCRLVLQLHICGRDNAKLDFSMLLQHKLSSRCVSR